MNKELKYGIAEIKGVELQIERAANSNEKDGNGKPITFVSALAKSRQALTKKTRVTNLESGQDSEVITSVEKRITLFADGKEFPEAFAELRRAPNQSIIRIDGELDSAAVSKPGRNGGVFTDYHGRIMVTSVKIIEVPTA